MWHFYMNNINYVYTRLWDKCKVKRVLHKLNTGYTLMKWKSSYNTHLGSAYKYSSMKKVVHKLWKAYCGDGLDYVNNFHRMCITVGYWIAQAKLNFRPKNHKYSYTFTQVHHLHWESMIYYAKICVINLYIYCEHYFLMVHLSV